MLFEKEYKQLTGHAPADDMTIDKVFEEGLPLSAFDKVAVMLGASKVTTARLLKVTTRSLQQRIKAHSIVTLPEGRLNTQITDRAFQLARLTNEAAEYFGSLEAANKWMNTPNMGLRDQSPLALCASFTGMERVRDSLNRLKYGMTA
jgi:putative toxin-antitoxin system antitoxin component (TIGR02293 family)